MAIRLGDQVIDEIYRVLVDGKDIMTVDNTPIHITIEAECCDVTDDSGNIIKKRFVLSRYAFSNEHEYVQILAGDDKPAHQLCITGTGWRSRPHKKKRIAKKWEKRYGMSYGFCSVNRFVRGDLVIRTLD